MGESDMRGIGTIANVCAIVAGGTLGLLLRGGLKARYQNAVMRALGLCTLFIGGAGALAGLMTVAGDTLQMEDTLGMILSLVLGTLIGEVLNLEGRLEQLGIWLREKTARGDKGRFVEGFVTASLVVCVGAMAIVGSLKDALEGDPSTLYTKSMLDFMIIMIFASTYGKGAIFSALPVGVLQGSVTLCAFFLAPLFSGAVIANLSFVGAILIFCVGANLAFDSKFHVANMLPALVVGAVYVSLV